MDENLVTLRLFLEPCMTFSCLNFENYLQCRTQSVKATISSSVANICGIPQRSIQGPRIF